MFYIPHLHCCCCYPWYRYVYHNHWRSCWCYYRYFIRYFINNADNRMICQHVGILGVSNWIVAQGSQQDLYVTPSTHHLQYSKRENIKYVEKVCGMTFYYRNITTSNCQCLQGIFTAATVIKILIYNISLDQAHTDNKGVSSKKAQPVKHGPRYDLGCIYPNLTIGHLSHSLQTISPYWHAMPYINLDPSHFKNHNWIDKISYWEAPRRATTITIPPQVQHSELGYHSILFK